jgi:hypothetical protein
MGREQPTTEKGLDAWQDRISGSEEQTNVFLTTPIGYKIVETTLEGDAAIARCLGVGVCDGGKVVGHAGDCVCVDRRDVISDLDEGGGHEPADVLGHLHELRVCFEAPEDAEFGEDV